MTMRYKKLGKSDIDVSVIAFGAWITGRWAWSNVSDDDSIKAIRKAFSMGINLFDTAPVYGFGHSETILSKAMSGNRKDIIIATKCGLEWDGKGNINKNSSSQRIINEVNDSLKRLNTDYIDLYQVHWHDKNTPISETFSTLKEIQNQGKIRYIGVSNFTAELIKEASQYCEIVSSQPLFNMLDRDIEAELLPYCLDNNIATLAYSPLAKGLLTGKFDKSYKPSKSELARKWDKNFKEENFQRNLEIVEKLQEISASINKPLNEIALNWILKHDAATSVLTGARNEQQISQNAQTGAWEMSDDIFGRINKILDA